MYTFMNPFAQRTHEPNSDHGSCPIGTWLLTNWVNWFPGESVLLVVTFLCSTWYVDMLINHLLTTVFSWPSVWLIAPLSSLLTVMRTHHPVPALFWSNVTILWLYVRSILNWARTCYCSTRLFKSTGSRIEEQSISNQCSLRDARTHVPS